MKNPLKFWLGTLTVFILALTPSVVPVGESVAPASAATVASGACQQTVDLATGVTATSVTVGGVSHCLVTFTATGSRTWTVPAGVTQIEYLIVAGGGAGGRYRGGGGGGGGVLEGSATVSSGNQTITVGAGGAGASLNHGTAPTNGSNSSAFGLTALGGGRGGTTLQHNPQTGGSGGGGGAQDSDAQPGALGTAGQGFGGGAGSSGGGTANGRSGGGGGAGGAGLAGTSSGAGNGGPGVLSTITGSHYGGGGGGGLDNRGVVKSRGLGGSGGGGAGGTGHGGGTLSSPDSPAVDGQANTGGGGGGNGQGENFFDSGTELSGDGGSGIVAVRYSLTPGAPTGLTVTPSAGQASLSWTAPAYTGGLTISDYIVEYRESGGSWTTFADGTSATTSAVVTGLTNGTSYTFRVSAVNAATTGPASANASAASGEVLRLDATHLDSFSSGDTLWTDLTGGFDAALMSGVGFDTRTKSFVLDGTDDFFQLPTMTTNFSQGISIHYVVDFGVTKNWERVLEFSNGGTAGGIALGRYIGTDQIILEISNADGSGKGSCLSAAGAIQRGLESYSVVVDSSGNCTHYRNGISVGTGTNVLPVAMNERSLVRVGRDRGDGTFSGAIQSVVIYNRAQVTPVCAPFESNFIGDGTNGTVGVLYESLTFSTVGTCTWTPPSGTTSLDYVVVGGGGAGGFPVGTNRGAGGGGAGGYQAGPATVSTEPYNVSVGRGGASAFAHFGSGTPSTASGSASSAFSVTANGGGGGGQSGTDRDSSSGLSGASGGGAGNFDGIRGNSGTGGNIGGAQAGDWSGGGAGGGGGGSGVAGGNASGSGASANGGVGGAGTVSSLNGSAQTFAAGGGGAHGGTGNSGSGGSGVGGTGSTGTLLNAQAGISGTGSGGGGARFGVGGAGGSGVVVVRYVLETQTVTFNKGTASGATGADRTSSKTRDVALVLPDSTTANSYFTRTGFTVTGWSEDAGGSTSNYALGANYTSNLPDTLYPVWTADTYVVTFSKGSASGATGADQTATKTHDVNLVLPNSATANTYFTRSGFSVTSWSVNANGSTADYALGANYTTEAIDTLYPVWTANTYVVTFNKGSVSGATGADQTATKTGGVNLVLPNSATANGYFTKSGFTVVGWSVNADGSTTDFALGGNYTTEAIDTLYPVWSASSFTVTFNKGSVSGATGADQSAAKTGGVSLALPNSETANGYFTKTGYTVTGWSVNADGSTVDFALGGAYTTDASDTLYPVWTPKTYTVTYTYNNATGGNSVSSTSYTVDGIRVSLPTPTRTGFTFDGWYSEVGLSTLVGGAGASYAPTSSVTLYAKWSAATFAVVFEYNGATDGNSVTSASFTTGETVITLPTPTRAGYVFGGWYANAGLTTSVGAGGASYSPSVNLTIFAKWTAISRSVTYNSTNTGGGNADSGSVPTDGGSYIIGNTVVVKANSGVVARTGYTFEGWVTNADGTGTALNAGQTLTVAEANINLYPKWSANTYTISYNANGGTGNLSSAPSSWQTGTSNVTLPNSGLTKTGFTFDGWQELGSTTRQNYSYQPNYEDVTLVARWTIKSIDYSFSQGDAVGVSISGWPADSSANFGSTITLPNFAGRTVTIGGSSYLFFGWALGGTTYNSGDTHVMGETPPTFTAQWVRLFDVRFGFGGGTHSVAGDGASECTTGGLCVDDQPIVLRTAPERPGYTFDGWKVHDTYTVKSASAAHQVSALEYLFYAQWTAVQYQFTFNALGGSVNSPRVERIIGQVVTLPSPGTRTGYTFAGWSADSGVTSYITGSSYMVGTAGKAFSAQWIPDVYTVTYDWQGGAGSTPRVDDSYTVGTGDMTLPTAAGAGFSRDGFTFSGWSTSIGGSLVSGFRPSADDVLYAVWADGNYTLTFDAKGGTLASPTGSVARGTSTTLPTPLRSNFTFIGWFDQATGGTKLGDGGGSFTPGASRTLFARWVQDSLFGVDLATLETAVTYEASSSSSIDTTLTHNPTGTSARVQIPSGALPDGTVVTVRYFKETAHQANLIPGDNSYFFALLVSWLSGTGDAATVPNTAAGKPITVTLNNTEIKAGAMVYQVIGTRVTELGRATVDGSVTVQLTEDPQIAVAATRPMAPSAVSGTAGDTRATLSWTASNSGGSAITGYTVTASPGGATCSTASTSCTISSLSNNTAYTFRVEATNAQGASSLSSPSSSVTPVGANYAVTFASNAGSAVINGSFFSGSTVSAPVTPSRSGFTFVGWTTILDDATTRVTFPYSPGVTSPISLFALWDVAAPQRGGAGNNPGAGSASGLGTSPPSVSRRPITGSLQAPVVPPPLTSPVVIAPERGFDPGAGSQASVGGQPTRVITTRPTEGGISMGVGRVQLGITPTNPAPSTAPTPPGGATELSVSRGQSATVSGGGLLPGSQLQVWLPGLSGVTPQEIARLSVRADGTFESEMTFSARQSNAAVPIGRQVLQVTGVDERGNQTVVDMTVTIAQGEPVPELNRTLRSLPSLAVGESLATSAGVPETVTVEARPQSREVAVISGDWTFTVGLPDGTGDVDAGGAITLVREQSASVSGTGFQPDTRVDVWLFSEPVLLGSMIVAADGSVSGGVVLAGNYVAVGDHTLQLQGVGTDGFIKAANLGVVVESSAPLPADPADGVPWWAFALLGFVLLLGLTVALSMGRRSRSARH